jgi:hypothetical protein
MVHGLVEIPDRHGSGYQAVVKLLLAKDAVDLNWKGEFD